MLWLETKYVGLISARLNRFERVEDNVWKFRCPVCGDSKKNQYKTRGFIYEKSGQLNFICHNCGASSSFVNFLKTQDETLFQEFLKERRTEKRSPSPPDPIQKAVVPVFKKVEGWQNGLVAVNKLPQDHPAQVYLRDRMIPPERFGQVFYCEKFFTWTNTVLPKKYHIPDQDEPRLVFPFLLVDQTVIGFQARAFHNRDNRYLSMVVNRRYPLIWGLDHINPEKTIYALEGVLDALFVDNSVAAAGGDIAMDLVRLAVDKSRAIVVYDNEPRKPETVQKMLKAVKLGFPVVVWPSYIQQKDLNAMVQAGIPISDINQILVANVFVGRPAQLEINRWKKVDDDNNSQGNSRFHFT